MQVLLHEQEHGVALFGGEGGEDLERVSIAHTVVERCVGVYGIGHTAVFANGLEVAFGEDLSEGIGSHSVLEGIGLFAVPELNEHGLRTLEFTLETIHEHALAGTNAEVGVSFALLHAGERGDVLLAEGAKRIFVECSGEVEIEIAGGSEAFAVEAFDLVVAHLVEIGKFEGLGAGIRRIERGAHGVAEGFLRIFVGIFQLRAKRGHDVVEGVGIVRGLLEIEVEEFEEGAEILGRGGAFEGIGVLAEADAETNLLAGEFLLQFGGGEVAPAGGVHDGFDEFSVEHVFVGELVGTAPAVGGEENLGIVEVGLLEEDAGAVGERPLRVAEGRFGGLGHLAGFGQDGHEGFALHIVDIGFDLSITTGLHGGFHLVDSGHFDIGLVGIHGEEDEVGIVGEVHCGQGFVDGLLVDLTGEHLVVVVESGDVGGAGAVEEVAHATIHIVIVLLLLAVVVEGLVVAEEVFAGTEQFTAGDAVLREAIHFFHDGRHGFGIATGLGRDVEREGIFGLREEVVVITQSGHEEGAILLLTHFAQTTVEGLRHGGDHVAVEQTEHRATVFLGDDVSFEHDRDRAHGLFLVLVDDVDGLRIVGHGVGFVFRCVSRHGHGTEDLLHLGFDLCGVNVAHDHHALQVGTIPLLVVGAEKFGFEVVDD